MAKVTSTVIVHRPERVLYYLPEMTEEANRCIADGVCPSVLKEYQYAFGTYDDVGIFFLPPSLQEATGKRCVMGIEYRKDDPALVYPEYLPSMELPACDVIIQDITYEEQLSRENIKEIIEYGRNTRNGRSEQYDYAEDGIVGAFAAKEKLRVLYEINLRGEPAAFLTYLRLV